MPNQFHSEFEAPQESSLRITHNLAYFTVFALALFGNDIIFTK